MIYHLFKLIAISFLLFLKTPILGKQESGGAQIYNVSNILKLEINSSVNPATFDYLSYNFKKHNKNTDLVLITMNTPGGLVSTTKKIISLIASSEKPVIIWVGPSGSSATSAGAIIASSATILTMAQGTNIGAATPINTTGDMKESDLRSKAINDIVSLVKAQSQSHSRNHKPFTKMIEEAMSYTAKDAFAQKAIDFIANDVDELLTKLNGQKVFVKNENFKLKLNKETVAINHAQMDLGQKLLNILSSPNLAYILFLIGAALIYLEFQAPGGIVAGALGAVFLMLAGISFQVLPLNFGALGLIVLSFVLLILEIYITSFGILSLAALASLISGSMFLFRTDDSYLSVSFSIIFATVAAISSFLVIVGYIFMKSREAMGVKKFNSQLNQHGTITEVLESDKYIVKSHGEYWRAMGPKNLNIGDKIKIICKNDDMTYTIEQEITEDEI